MLEIVATPRKSWLPGGSEGKSIPLTAVTAAHSPELWMGGHTSVAYSCFGFHDKYSWKGVLNPTGFSLRREKTMKYIPLFGNETISASVKKASLCLNLKEET